MSTESAEAGLLLSELQALNRSFATVVFDHAGRIVRANNRFLRLFGYELDEVIGQNISLFAPPDETAAAYGGDEDDEDGTSLSRRLRKDGSEIWVRFHRTPIRDAAGRLKENVAIVSDVSSQQRRTADDRSQIEAIHKSQAVVQFALDGTILDANDRFLDIVGYRLNEIVGCHHRMLVEPAIGDSEAYADFWGRLSQGCHQAGEYKRLAKGEMEVWLQATYNPIFDPSGRLVKIVKYALDVTAQKLRQAEYEWQIAAIHKSHAVITFDLNGAILEANDIFLDAVGYSMAEICGRHHRMFVEPSHAHSIEYAGFWRDLNLGRHHAGEYKRIGKNGREIWLQASYNPIFDMNGRPMRVVKYASVLTHEKRQHADHQGQIAAIHKSQAVVSFGLDGKVLDANDNFLDMMGYRYVEVLGRHHRMFQHPGDRDTQTSAAFWRELGEGRHQAGEFLQIGKNGREVWLQATFNPIFDLNGRPFKIVEYAVDITDEKLRRADYQGQIEAIGKSQGVVTLSLDGTILEANENILAALGYDAEELRGQHHSMLVTPEAVGSDDYAKLWRKLRAGEFHSGMIERVGKSGRRVWLQATYNPILDPKGQPFKVVKFATDVTKNVALAEAFEDAKRQAQLDSVTGLPNRARLMSFLGSALNHSTARFSLFYLDLDRFADVGEALGHEGADGVLAEIADRLRRFIEDDQIVARVGNSEFVIAGPDQENDETEAFCDRLLAAIAVPVRFKNREFALSASLGIAVAPDDAREADELLRCADLALSRAKEEGGARYRFHSAERNARSAADRRTIDEMRRSIALGQFFLEYQPRYDTNNRTVRSVEALVRWLHPERGRISPAEFIPLAERSGLVGPLGEWILRTACRTIAPMSGIGVSVNVSPVQFRDDRFCDVVASALAEAGMEGSRLELEITEGVLMEDAERARHMIGQLKSLGVKLAMDDFGTGYSSMSYLCDFPFDVIKIDRRFISNMEDGGGRAVVQAILGLGKALGLDVTAEGVETNEQLAMLTRDQCREVQGFLLARPMSEEALLSKLNEDAEPVRRTASA
ncbi:sensor domain-containing protein [Aureimonas psammosilenae]|uniref:sensor domain-containing protein n=1 Tax=Aureimonas psammosilenae TaxID=2495496 RepID=UPI00186AAF5F|nr:PAS domain S-box protein [Aureimonas psammosilenae]